MWYTTLELCMLVLFVSTQGSPLTTSVPAAPSQTTTPSLPLSTVSGISSTPLVEKSTSATTEKSSVPPTTGKPSVEKPIIPTSEVKSTSLAPPKATSNGPTETSVTTEKSPALKTGSPSVTTLKTPISSSEATFKTGESQVKPSVTEKPHMSCCSGKPAEPKVTTETTASADFNNDGNWKTSKCAVVFLCFCLSLINFIFY